jgi:predicted secreted protein
MSWTAGLAIYVVIWWLVIFMVLPFGRRDTISEEDVDKGQDAGAPVTHRILFKMAVTTVASGVLFGAFYWTVESGAISFIE